MPIKCDKVTLRSFREHKFEDIETDDIKTSIIVITQHSNFYRTLFTRVSAKNTVN